MKITEFLKVGQVVQIAFAPDVASVVFHGRSGQYVAILDSNADGVLLEPVLDEVDETSGHRVERRGAPAFVHWGHIVAVRQHPNK